MPKLKSSSGRVSGVPHSSPVEVIAQVEPLYLNKQQLARAVPVSERTVDNWKERGIIPYRN